MLMLYSFCWKNVACLHLRASKQSSKVNGFELLPSFSSLYNVAFKCTLNIISGNSLSLIICETKREIPSTVGMQESNLLFFIINLHLSLNAFEMDTLN